MSSPSKLQSGMTLEAGAGPAAVADEKAASAVMQKVMKVRVFMVLYSGHALSAVHYRAQFRTLTRSIIFLRRL